VLTLNNRHLSDGRDPNPSGTSDPDRYVRRISEMTGLEVTT
jgi:hypothetical protein